MSPFFQSIAKDKVKAAVQAIEAQTAAEIVVSVRDRSAAYRDVDYLVGFALAVLVLVGVIFHPAELNEHYFPLEVGAAFAFGSAVTAQLWAVKARLVGRERKRAEVGRSAAEQFVVGKIATTRARTGILVYVSAFEHMVELVWDIGVPSAKLAELFGAARAELEAALTRGDVDAFVAKLKELGPALAKDLPRAADDVNELPDEVT